MKSIRDKLNSYYFEDPTEGMIERNVSGNRITYFYFEDPFIFQTEKEEILNGCLLSGTVELEFEQDKHALNQFDLFFIPSNKKIELTPLGSKKAKVCLMQSKIQDHISSLFQLEKFDLDKFVPRGEHASSQSMSTYRTVWTAIKNGYFMSGFTNIPPRSLREGTITSVNLEKNKAGTEEIYPHIHPENPEVYIACIDDERYAITQYLISKQGISVCRDLTDGDGAFFPGEFGHSNFARPTYNNLKYCMYLWMIPTYGKSDSVNPITLK